MAAAGSIVESRNRIEDGQGAKMFEHRFVWTSSGGGAVQEINSTNELNGFVVGCKTIPGAVALQPTDQYDLTILDSDGCDVLGGEGMNRSNTNKEQVMPKIGNSYGARFVKGKVQITIAVAGGAKSGTVVLHVSRV